MQINSVLKYEQNELQLQDENEYMLNKSNQNEHMMYWDKKFGDESGIKQVSVNNISLPAKHKLSLPTIPLRSKQKQHYFPSKLLHLVQPQAQQVDDSQYIMKPWATKYNRNQVQNRQSKLKDKSKVMKQDLKPSGSKVWSKSKLYAYYEYF